MKKARLVWDGDKIRVPEEMGTPAPGQLTGTPLEQLTELAVRICYHSLGTDENGKPRGRSTEDTLANIMARDRPASETKHFSTLEHANKTIEFCDVPSIAHEEFLLAFVNRPGCHLRWGSGKFRVTINLRAVLEWDKWSAILIREHGPDQDIDIAKWWSDVGEAIRFVLQSFAPLIIDSCRPLCPDVADAIYLIQPETAAEEWVSLWLRESRGFTHEMVRHRFAISQRSTRYCDETEAVFHKHPLLEEFAAETHLDGGVKEEARQTVIRHADLAALHARKAYAVLVEELETWLKARGGVKARDARKQARGAARYYMGHNLDSQMIFSAPTWGWRHILYLRGVEGADAPIRAVAVEMLEAIRESRYAARFEDIEIVPATDGLGSALRFP